MSASLLPSSIGSEFAELIEEITTRLQTGDAIDVEALAAEHPEHAEAIKQLLPALRALADLSQSVTNGEPLGALAAEPNPSGSLGDFRIVREIGRGGMGVVYEAEQISLARRVALKILPFAGVLDARQLQRFKNEAQAAAQLDHPNIVDVIGIGHDRGVHFYAMRFIDGLTLAQVIAAIKGSGFGVQGSADDVSHGAGRQERVSDVPDTRAYSSPHAPRVGNHHAERDAYGTAEHHDAENGDAASRKTALTSALSRREREQQKWSTLSIAGLATDRGTHSREFFVSLARLGIQAAEALDHAHQVGVIHRDVKPSNLMLDARGKLWVTDFGLAHVESNTELTFTGDLLGTLRYMSPEQALAKRGLVDHRGDVYSLGATLYELVTLEPVFPSFDRQELLRAIAFDDPVPPRKLNRLVPAELATIVLKALEKSPGDRYATAQELADDLRRFTEERPIHARRPNLRERAVKWARRHTAVVTAAGITMLIAVLALSVSLWRINAALDVARGAAELETKARLAATTATEQEKKARLDEAAQRKRAETVTRFLMDAFRSSDPAREGPQAKVVDVLDKSVAALDEKFADAPQEKAALLHALGIAYLEIGLPDKAEPLCQRSLKLERELYGPRHRATLESMQALANSYDALGRSSDALRLREETLALQKEELGAQDRDTLGTMYGLAVTTRKLGRFSDALKAYEDVIDMQKTVLGPDHLDTLASRHGAAATLLALGRYTEARDLEDETLSRLQATVGPKHPSTLNSMTTLANCLRALGRLEEALKLNQETLALHTDISGPDHPHTLGAKFNVAQCYYSLGRYADALPVFEQTTAELKRKLGDDHPNTLECMNGLALCYGSLRRTDEGLKLNEAILALRKAKLGDDHPDTLQSMQNLALSYLAARRPAEAIELLEEALPLYKVKRGPVHRFTLQCMNCLAQSYFAVGRDAEAVKLLEEILAVSKATLGPDHGNTMNGVAELARAYRRVGRHEEALALNEQALEWRKAHLGADHAETLNIMNNLANSYLDVGRHVDAVQLHKEVYALRKVKFGPDDPQTLATMCNLAACYARGDQHGEALKLFEEALALEKVRLGPDHPESIKTLWATATCLIRLNRGTEAVPLIDECVKHADDKGVDTEMALDVISMRMDYFQEKGDTVGCRETAEMWESLHRAGPNNLYHSACFRSVLAAVIRSTAGDASQPASADAQVELERAMEWLNQAAAGGFEDVELLEKDQKLAALRERDNFKRLVAEIKARVAVGDAGSEASESTTKADRAPGKAE